jgi:hypothetical protein
VIAKALTRDTSLRAGASPGTRLVKLSKADQAKAKKVRSEQGVEAALKVAASKASISSSWMKPVALG